MEKESKSCANCGNIYYKRVTCSNKEWEQSKFCSRSCTARSRNLSYLFKHQFKKGDSRVKTTQFVKGQTTNDKNINWKGDGASYAAKHIWVRNHYGKPSLCEHCGVTDRKMYHWANVSRQYKRERSDWLRLCVPCHKKLDLSTLTTR